MQVSSETFMLKLLDGPPNKTVLVAWSKKSWGPATDFADEIFKISVVSCSTVSKFSGAQSKCPSVLGLYVSSLQLIDQIPAYLHVVQIKMYLYIV